VNSLLWALVQHVGAWLLIHLRKDPLCSIERMILRRERLHLLMKIEVGLAVLGWKHVSDVSMILAIGVGVGVGDWMRLGDLL